MTNERNKTKSSKKNKFISKKEALSICKKSGVDECYSHFLIEKAIHCIEVDREILEKKIQEELDEQAELEKERQEYFKQVAEKRKDCSFLARIFLGEDGKLSAFKSTFFTMTIIVIASISEPYLRKLYIGEECPLGYAGSWTEKKCIKQLCYHTKTHVSRFFPETHRSGWSMISNLILLDSYIYSDEKGECVPRCDNKQYWKEGECYLAPYYKHISNELFKKIDNEKKELEQYFLKNLERYKEENKKGNK